MLDKNQVCAIIVTFHPDIEFITRLLAILNELDKVIIIDNSADPLVLNHVKLHCRDNRILFIENHVNAGIAKALNQGIQLAEAEGYQWVWSFDQDTLVPSGILSKLVHFYNTSTAKSKIGVIGPNYKDVNCGTYFIPLERGGEYLEVPTLINSGSLIKIENYHVVGGFDEKLFIDGVDHDFCLMMRHHGYKIIVVKNALIYHKIGYSTRHRFLHKIITVTNNSPLRRYYFSRNSWKLMLKYMSLNPSLAIELVKVYLKSVIVTVIFEKQRLSKIKYLTLGFFDAVRNKSDRDFSVELSVESKIKAAHLNRQ
jgi:rhamnosyltransferase